MRWSQKLRRCPTLKAFRARRIQRESKVSKRVETESYHVLSHVNQAVHVEVLSLGGEVVASLHLDVSDRLLCVRSQGRGCLCHHAGLEAAAAWQCDKLARHVHAIQCM